MYDEQFQELRSIVLRSPLISALLSNWSEIGLPDCWLVAGAVTQTVWNHKFGYPAMHGINDIDLVYFDANDLSEKAEAEQAARIQGAFCDLPAWLDVKNEARVHLWYEAKFGYPIEPYTSAAHAITTFPTTATAVGLRSDDNALKLYAPFGLSDLFRGIVRPNKKQITREIYAQKVDRWITAWPKLTVVTWGDKAEEV